MDGMTTQCGYAELAAYLRTWGELPDAEIERARQVFRPIDVPERTLLVKAGEPPSRVFFSVTGLSRVFYVDEDGTERIKGFRAERNLICAYAAMLRGRKSNVYIETVETSRLLVALREPFDQLAAGNPAWRDIIARITEQRLVEEEDRHAELLRYDATRRYQHFLAEEPALAARLTQRLIASYIGITPVALSRIKGQLAGR